MSTPQTLPEIKNAILSDTLNVLLDASTWVRVGHSAYLYINKATAATLAEVEEDDLPQEGDLPIPFASNNIHVHCGLDGGIQKYSLVVVDATEPVYGDEPSPDDKYDMNKQVDVNVPAYIAPVEVFPSFGKEAMKKVTVALSNIPVIESNKDVIVNVSDYSAPIEVTPSLGKNGMAKTTITLSSIPTADINFFSSIIPGFLLDDYTPVIAVNADGTLVSDLTDVPNAKFIVSMQLGGSQTECWRKDDSSVIPHNANVYYNDNQDFTITNGEITLLDISRAISATTLYLNNYMTSTGS